MASSSIFSPKFTPTPNKYPSIAVSSMMSTKILTSFSSHLPSMPLQYVNCKRDFPIAKVASIPYEPVNQDYLEGEFSGHGVTFEGIGDSCVAKMELQNGSIAKLMLPSGLITSYKAHMWHQGVVELLHTSVSEVVDDDDDGDDEAIIQGGISLALSFESGDQDSWSPSTWSLHQVSGSPADSIQIEIISNDPERKIRLKHIVTLEEDFLSSELVVSNSSSTSLKLLGGVISHLTVSSPDAIYVLGLEGSSFFTRKPILSEFVITPPDYGLKDQPGYGQVYGKMSLGALMSTLGSRKHSNADEIESSNSSASEEDDIEGEEDDGYKQLTDEMCRIYTYAPRAFTVMDRGRRNSLSVGRSGFEELYMMSPGSNHEFYSKYAYICVGQSAMLKPIIVGPGDEWRGGMFIHNPNLE
uniref:NDH-dependent cyclic electron flow 5 n=1 Tax=Pelargonium dichondrifolium TaxID=73194 RepID=A0A0F7GZP9_9ROSI